MSVEDVRKELEKESKADIDRASKEYVDSVKDFNEVGNKALYESTDYARESLKNIDSSADNKPVEAMQSKGYDPSIKPGAGNSSGVSRGSGVSPSNDSGINHQHHSGNGLPKQEGVGEQAPDVGKDYGSVPASNDYDQVGNGYNPYDDRVNQGQTDGQEKGKPEKQSEDQEKNKDTKKDEEKKNGSDGESSGPKKDDPLKKENVGDSQNKDKTSESTDSKKGGSSNSNSKSAQNDGQDGNGYGALRKKQQPGSSTDMSDPTSRARRNWQRNNQNKSDNKPVAKSSSGSKTPAKGGSPLKNAINKAGAGIKNAANKIGNKGNNNGGKGASNGDEVANKALGGLKNLIFRFLMSHPLSIVVIAIIVIILIVLLFDAMDAGRASNGRGKRSCTYELNGVTSTGTAELANLKVEVINCDGTEDNYEVLTTVDFEKYVLGVALAEAGASSPDEAIKAQIIAVRNFTLTRNSGMCPSHPESCFHGYNESSGIIRMRACTNDQVFWDYTKDCPKIERSGKPTLYCEGVAGSSDIWKKALSEQRQKEVEALANSVMGEVLLDENGNVLKLGYQKDETDQFIADANAGKSYVEILEAVYGSSSYSSAKCSYGGVYDYGDYELSSEGDPILHQPLDQFLESQGTSLEEFNELIIDNVDDAGYGTRAGVVAGSVTLVAELGNNYDVKVPYYWGGGHSSNDLSGEALAKWGSTQCHTFANGIHYNYCGLDCSGFVAWALNAGGFRCGPTGAGSFYEKNGAQKIKLNPNAPVLQPGDILEYVKIVGGERVSGHAILVVGIDEDTKEYICIEAQGNDYGVLFTRRSFGLDGYWGVDMEDFYNNPSNLREPRE